MPEMHRLDWSVLLTFKNECGQRRYSMSEELSQHEMLVEQDYIEEGAADVQSAVVIDEA